MAPKAPKGKVRLVQKPQVSAEYWAEIVANNETLLASFVQYMDDLTTRAVTQCARETLAGNTAQALRYATWLDIRDQVRLFVVSKAVKPAT